MGNFRSKGSYICKLVDFLTPSPLSVFESGAVGVVLDTEEAMLFVIQGTGRGYPREQGNKVDCTMEHSFALKGVGIVSSQEYPSSEENTSKDGWGGGTQGIPEEQAKRIVVMAEHSL